MRTLTGWSALKWAGRMILWIPPLTPIGIWMSLRHHRWKARQETAAILKKHGAETGSGAH